mgnify:CR=1 FL=1
MSENINYDKNQNYWIVFIKPFDNSWSAKYIEEFQQICYEQNSFGMGWNYATDKEFIKIQKLASEMLEKNISKVEIKKLYKDVLIYKKGYKLTELDRRFITKLCETKRKIFN